MTWIAWLADTPQRLVAVNAAVLLVACTAGWLVGVTASGPATTHVFEPGRAEDVDFTRDVMFIVSGNLRVLLALLLGACTLGLLNIMVVAWNGYGLGFGLAVLSEGSPAVVQMLMRYLPVEFSAIVLASTGAMLLSRWIVGVLLVGDAPRLKSAGCLGAASLLLIVLAAIIEAGVKQDLATP